MNITNNEIYRNDPIIEVRGSKGKLNEPTGDRFRKTKNKYRNQGFNIREKIMNDKMEQREQQALRYALNEYNEGMNGDHMFEDD